MIVNNNKNKHNTTTGVTFTLTFSCNDEDTQHELTAALRNSSSPVLPTVN